MKKKITFITIIITVILSLHNTCCALENIRDLLEGNSDGVYVMQPKKNSSEVYEANTAEIGLKNLLSEDNTLPEIWEENSNIIEDNVYDYQYDFKVMTSNNEITMGFLDMVNKDCIAGWAWCANRPNDAINVHIYIYNEENGKQYGPYSLKADRYRNDLEKAGYGNGCHGFSRAINWNTLPVGKYRIMVYAIGDEGNPLLNNCPKYYEVVNPNGYLDCVNLHQISGWAWCESEPDNPINVLIAIYRPNGAVLVYEVKADSYREDLLKIGAGSTGKYAFNFSPDWEYFVSGTYTINVYATTADGTLYSLLHSPAPYVVSASAIGTYINNDSKLDNLDSRAVVQEVKDGYKQAKYNDNLQIYIDPLEGQLRNSLYSKIQFFALHGNFNNLHNKNSGIWTGDESIVSPYGVKLMSFKEAKAIWDLNTRFITFFSCLSAGDGNVNKDSIAYRTVAETRVKAAVGFLGNISTAVDQQWTERYMNKLTNGYGIYDAVKEANNHIYIQDGITNNCIIYTTGNENMKLFESSNASSLSTKEENVIKVNRKLNSKEDFLNELNKIDENFDIDNYEIRERNGCVLKNVDTGEETIIKYIDYQLKIGDFYTNAGYTFEIENDLVSNIYNNNIEKTKKIALQCNNYEEIDEVIYLDNVKNKKMYYYDIENEKKYLILENNKDLKNME